MFPDALREHMVAAAKLGATEALDHFHKDKQSYFNGITAEQHVTHHADLAESMKVRQWVKDKFIDGAGAAISRTVAVIGAILFVAVMFSLFGSLMSDNFRHWLASMLGGG